MAFVRFDHDEDVRARIVQRLKAGPAWSWELAADLHIAPAIIDEAIADLKGDGLVFRPERDYEGTTTFDRWRAA
jgi:Mn-dependent DtxR family transcriptional regulator